MIKILIIRALAGWLVLSYPLNRFFVLRRDLNNTGLVQEISGTFSRHSTSASLSLAFLGLVDHSNKILLVLNKSRVREEMR